MILISFLSWLFINLLILWWVFLIFEFLGVSGLWVFFVFLWVFFVSFKLLGAAVWCGCLRLVFIMFSVFAASHFLGSKVCDFIFSKCDYKMWFCVILIWELRSYAWFLFIHWGFIKAESICLIVRFHTIVNNSWNPSSVSSSDDSASVATTLQANLYLSIYIKQGLRRVMRRFPSSGQ